MKRDMDLIRELLLKLESFPAQPGAVYCLTGHEPEMAIDGYSGDQIQYHLDLLKKAGLIDSPGSQPVFGVTYRGLTWSGHDFLDSVRSPETWRKTKEGAKKIGNWSVDLLFELQKPTRSILRKSG